MAAGTSPGPRALIIGVGLETCIGNDLPTFWASLRDGRSGIRPIAAFDTTGGTFHVAGEIEFDPSSVMNRTELRRTERPTQLLLSAVLKACADAGTTSMERTGLVVGTGGAGIPTLGGMLERLGPDRCMNDPFLLMKTLPNMPAAHVAKELSVQGPVLTVSSACASSTDALGMAHALLRAGTVDSVLCAGVEAWIYRPILDAFDRIRAISRRPAAEAAEASRPFDLGRDGMVPAEAAVALMLRREDACGDEVTRCYGTLLGGASTCDAWHAVQPRPDAAAAVAAIEQALRNAGVDRSEVNLVCAHATSTPLNDVVETNVLKQVLGPRADRVPIIAPKSVTGHSSGACGAVEAVATVLALQHGLAPPTANLTDPDPECNLDYVGLVAREISADIAVSCNFGFGGQNAAVVLGKAPS